MIAFILNHGSTINQYFIRGDRQSIMAIGLYICFNY